MNCCSLDSNFCFCFKISRSNNRCFFTSEVVSKLAVSNCKFGSVEVAPKTFALIIAGLLAERVFVAVINSCLQAAQVAMIVRLVRYRVLCCGIEWEGTHDCINYHGQVELMLAGFSAN